MKTILGIDPGASGAVAVINEAGEFIGVWDFSSDPAELADALRSALASTSGSRDYTSAVLEHVHSMPKQGVASSFTFGAGFGAVRGILSYAAIRYDLVPPQRWKKAMGLSREKYEALAMARRLFPTAELHLKKHDGRAEALLIAEWGRRHLFNRS